MVCFDIGLELIQEGNEASSPFDLLGVTGMTTIYQQGAFELYFAVEVSQPTYL
jgi:hypothetical protein